MHDSATDPHFRSEDLLLHGTKVLAQQAEKPQKVCATTDLNTNGLTIGPDGVCLRARSQAVQRFLAIQCSAV